MTSYFNTAKKKPNSAKLEQNSWYAKLHPIGTDQQTPLPKRPLNLSIFFRIWLAVALVLVICGVVVFTQLFSYVKPTVKQVIEDTLLDASKLLASSLYQPLQSGLLYDDAYQAQLDTVFIDMLSENNTPATSYEDRTYSSFRVYVTDNKGIVIYDSLLGVDNAEGKDYSRWNDVYLTLRGQYGARSTVRDNRERDSSVMYVAQPILDRSGQTLGVVSVGKPVASVLPYLDNTRRRMLITALIVSIVALMLAGLVAWWLKQSISLVTRYTSALAEDTQKPYFYLGNELNTLTDTIETMKHRLENKAYVSDYVHTLTHELKSPLTAIRASSELLEDEGLDDEDRQMLIQTVNEQSIKMQQLIDRLLLLAKVEQPSFKLNRQLTPLFPLIESLKRDNTVKVQRRQLADIEIYIDDRILTTEDLTSPTLSSKTTVYADRFWLVQSLQNLLDNAIHFADSKVMINIKTTEAQVVTVDISNDGKLLPEYALSKVFDRYFSLSHQSTVTQKNKTLSPSMATDAAPSHSNNINNNSTLRKGTGLGLTLVKQVVEHHGGQVRLINVEANANHPFNGVKVSITLPLAKEQEA